jgi:cellulose biosynthesis protein BcsQ
VSSLRIVTVASNKGGVGKTTLATNLAVYMRALREDLPILVLGLDDQDLIQRLFALDPETAAKPDVLDALRARALAPAIRLGQYGVHYVPPSPTISDAAVGLDEPPALRALLEESGWQGLVVIDTKSDLGLLTQSALAASDLALIPVADQTSLDQAERTYGLLDRLGRPRGQAHVVLSLVDRRVKYGPGEETDILALLLAEIRRRGYPCLESFLSRSPKIESLYTNREKRAHSILHGAQGSLVHRQMTHLASEVLCTLEALDAATAAPSSEPERAPAPAERRREERRREERRPFARRIAGFSFEDPPILALQGRDLSPHGIAVEPSEQAAHAGRVHLALAPLGGGERLLVWARVVRRDADRLALRFEIEGDAELQQRLRCFVAELGRAPDAALEGRASA